MTGDPTAPLTAYRGELGVLIDPAFAGGRGRGVLFAAARDVTTEAVRVMAVRGRGVCTVTLNESTAMHLGLRWQENPPADRDLPYYATSVEAAQCTETGISARERALTMRVVAAADTTAADVVSPGHIMIQIARNVFRTSPSLPEVANILMAACTDTKFAAWCDILDDDGEIADQDHCAALAQELGLPLFTAPDVIAFGREALADWARVVDFSKSRFR